MPRLGPALAVKMAGGRTGEFFPLMLPVTTIGRSPECEIFLDDITVSRAHAEVREGPGGFVLHDDGSTNGTYVNPVGSITEDRTLLVKKAGQGRLRARVFSAGHRVCGHVSTSFRVVKYLVSQTFFG
jgi:hypothetical protein